MGWIRMSKLLLVWWGSAHSQLRLNLPKTVGYSDRACCKLNRCRHTSLQRCQSPAAQTRRYSPRPYYRRYFQKVVRASPKAEPKTIAVPPKTPKKVCCLDSIWDCHENFIRADRPNTKRRCSPGWDRHSNKDYHKGLALRCGWYGGRWGEISPRSSGATLSRHNSQQMVRLVQDEADASAQQQTKRWKKRWNESSTGVEKEAVDQNRVRIA